MTGEIGSGGVAQSGADEDVRGEMLLRRIAGETHAGGQCIAAPFNPSIMGIAVSEDAGKGEAVSGVS